MPRNALGITLIVAGLLLIAISLLADVFGLGAEPGFGPKQTTGLVVGLVVGIVGLIITRRSARQ